MRKFVLEQVLVEVYTALIYEGPGLLGRINKGFKTY